MKTFEQIKEFNKYGVAVMKRHPNTKISYAIKKVLKGILSVVTEYNEAVEDIQIDHCFTNTSDVIEYDIIKDASGAEVRRYKFTKDQLKLKVKVERELLQEWNQREFDIKAYISPEIPDDITIEEKDALSGFVLER